MGFSKIKFLYGNGIGASLAKKHAKRGATLVLLDIDEEGGKRTLEDIKANGGKAFFFKCDVSKAEEIYQVAEEVSFNQSLKYC